jgi:hypothetical protein
MDDRIDAGLGSSRAGALRRRGSRLFLIALPLGFAAFAACGDDPCDGGTCVDESGARLLDRVCAQDLSEGPACQVSGAAEETSSVTADTIGFRLGDEGGSLTIHLQALEAVTYASGYFDIEVLAAARNAGSTPRLTSTFTWGSCAASCPTDPQPYEVFIPEEYAWITVVSGQMSTGATLQYDAALTLSGAGVDIADMRSTTTYPQGCSIAGPVGSVR